MIEERFLILPTFIIKLDQIGTVSFDVQEGRFPLLWVNIDTIHGKRFTDRIEIEGLNTQSIDSVCDLILDLIEEPPSVKLVLVNLIKGPKETLLAMQKDQRTQDDDSPF